MTYGFIIALLMCFFSTDAMAQSQTEEINAVGDSLIDVSLRNDSLVADSIYRDFVAKDSIASVVNESNTKSTPKKVWKPDTDKALWLALIIPGGGQIYNRKYWKLPIVYGGFVGCMYAFNWNSQMYKDYRQAYLDIMDSDPNTNSYKDFFRPGYDYEANKEYLQSVFKKRKDRYRRWRDLSIFATIGVYAISVIDAYVDAQLASFDINEDINLTIEPQVIPGNDYSRDKNYYGLNCNITF